MRLIASHMWPINTLDFILNHPLNRAHPGRALLRYLQWQCGTRVLNRPVLVDWVGGARFIADRGETGLTGNIYAGLHEFEEMAFVLHLLRPDDLFVDVGANSGSYTLLACAAAGARGIAMEPVPHTFRRLVRNVRLNELDTRVTCLNMAAGGAQGEVTFIAGEDTTNHVMAPGEAASATLKVPMTTLSAGCLR